MAFHEVLFPDDLSYGSSGGPKFKTTIFSANSGHEQRNIDWSNARAEYDVAHSIKDQSAMDVLTSFFKARNGRLNAFRFKDWNDYWIEDQPIGIGDSVTTAFQVVKTYISTQAESGETFTYTRRIVKLAWDSVEGVRVAGVEMDPDDYEIDYNTGIITFADSPYVDEEVSIDYAEFHVPARFDTDHLDVAQEFWNTGSWPNIPIFEQRLENSGVTATYSTESAFHEVLLPVNYDYGSSGGPKFKTGIFTADSGFESLVSSWSEERGEWNISHGIKSLDQMAELTSFFMCRRGKAYGFRFRDWNDYKIKQQVIGYGDAASTTFQIKKTYTSPQTESSESWSYQRTIRKIAWGTVAGVTIDGVPVTQHAGPSYPGPGNYYTVNENTGEITFRFPPAGPAYVTPAPSTALNYYTVGEGGVFDNFMTMTPLGGCFVDWTNGFIYRFGQSPVRGIRRLRLADGVEDYQVTQTTLGLPADLSGFVAVGPDGQVYVTCGTSFGRALIRLSLNSAFDLELGEMNGVPGISPNPFGSLACPGAVSVDNTRLVFPPAYGTSDILTVDTITLEVVRSFDPGSYESKATCPLYSSSLAILADDTEDTGNIALWDNSGNRLMLLNGTNAAGDWCVWDRGSSPGVVFGWHDDDGYWISKYSPASQAEVWRISAPDYNWNPISGQSYVADLFVWKAQDTLWYLNTVDGTVRTRACAQVSPDLAEDQQFDSRSMLIVAYNSTGNADAIIEAEIATGDEAGEPAEVKVGYCEFHVPVRFDTDHLNVVQEHWNTPSWPDIPIVEVRDWSEIEL